MKKRSLLAVSLLAVSALLFSPSVAFADSGVGGGNGGGSSADADAGGYWGIRGASGSCRTPVLQKYYSNGNYWTGQQFSYDSTVTNGHLINNSIGAVNYTFNGQNYNSGNLPVTYAWLVSNEQGAWSWWSQLQNRKENRGQIWINSVSATGHGKGQLLWVCASNVSTPTTSTSNDTRHCIVAVERRNNNGAWSKVIDDTAKSAESIYNNCRNSYSFNANSPGANNNAGLNKLHTLEARQITRAVTKKTSTVAIQINGSTATSKTHTTYSQAANVTKPIAKGTVQPTAVSVGPESLGYWYIDNTLPGGGYWVNASGAKIPESDTKRHNVKMTIGELWDDNKPVKADWIAPKASSKPQLCWSKITVPGKSTQNNAPGLTCTLGAQKFDLAGQKTVNGRTINLLSFAPVAKPAEETFKWTVDASATAVDIKDSRLIRSISNDPLAVNVSQKINISQPVKYGGYIPFSFSLNRGNGTAAQAAGGAVYNTPFTYTYSTSSNTKILGGKVTTYTANNEIN